MNNFFNFFNFIFKKIKGEKQMANPTSEIKNKSPSIDIVQAPVTAKVVKQPEPVVAKPAKKK
jgi:hypothetical protein